MTRWLSTEWFDQTRALAEGQPERPGLTARILYEITGGPDGDVTYHQVLEDGRLTAIAGGSIDGADVTLTMSWNDAAAMHQGTLDPNVAFMQGRLKVAGSMAVMMGLLAATTTPEYQEFRSRITAVTEY